MRMHDGKMPPFRGNRRSASRIRQSYRRSVGTLSASESSRKLSELKGNYHLPKYCEAMTHAYVWQENAAMARTSVSTRSGSAIKSASSWTGYCRRVSREEKITQISKAQQKCLKKRTIIARKIYGSNERAIHSRRATCEFTNHKS